MCCSQRTLRELLRRYLQNNCQPICALAVCDFQELLDLLLHKILEKSAKKAGTRQFEPMHLVLAVEELFPEEKDLSDFAKYKRKREKQRLLRRRKDEDDDELKGDGGGSSP